MPHRTALAATTCLLALSFATAADTSSDDAELLQTTAEMMVETAKTLQQRTASMRRVSRHRLVKRADGTQQPVEELEPWKDNHQAVKSKLTAEEIRAFGAEATKANLDKTMHELLDKNTQRFVAFDGNRAMSDIIFNRFRDAGLRTERHSVVRDRNIEQFMPSGSISPNIVGLLEGTDLSNETVVVAAHYDSVNWEQVTGPAPGVDDNGSGLSLVMSVMRALLRPGAAKPRRNVLFGAFNAEEVGLSGSDQFAEFVKHSKSFGDVKFVLIADEVAWPGKPDVEKTWRRAIFETKGSVPGARAMIDTLAHCVDDFGGDGIRGYEVNYNGFGSDHMSFLDRGIPAVLLIERDDVYHADKWGHSARDTFEHVDADYAAAMTRLAIRTAVTLANPA